MGVYQEVLDGLVGASLSELELLHSFIGFIGYSTTKLNFDSLMAGSYFRGQTPVAEKVLKSSEMKCCTFALH